MSRLQGERVFPGGNGACDSIIRIELITHFHRHPGMECTPERMAEAIGRDRLRVEAQLKKLVQLRILQERARGKEVYYRYLPPVSVSFRKREEKDATRANDAAMGMS